MEENQRKKFVCKFCNKKFTCGKSLGGHIRIHLNGNGNSVEEEESGTDRAFVGYDNEVESIIINSSNSNSSKRDSGPAMDATAAAAAVAVPAPVSASAFGGQLNYALQVSPKKKSKFAVDIRKTNIVLDKICKECGKGFQSLKALCGHMACHSKNNNKNATLSFEDYSGISHQEKLKEAKFDGQSDTENSAPATLRRSRRVKYKEVVEYSNGSSSSDVEQEQEEVAMCLMMLSQDSGFRGCFGSAADSSENNSGGLEGKSSCTKTKMCIKNGSNCVNDAKREIQNDNHSENSDSGYFTFGPKKSDSDELTEFTKHEVEFGSRFDDEEFDGMFGKRLSRFRRIRTELGKKLIDFGEHNQSDERTSVMFDSRKRSKIHSQNAESVSINGQDRGAKPNSFHLLENIRDCKMTRGYSDSLCDSVNNIIGTDNVPSLNCSNAGQSCNGKKPIIQQNAQDQKLGPKKSKVHRCPFCPKVFKSGQALGGHKRSHFIGGGEDRTLVINQEGPEAKMSTPRLIDLNLPAPMEERAAAGSGQW